MQVIADFQLKLNSLVIEAGDLNLVEKKKLAILSFVESVHEISKGFLTYDDRKDIDNHQCSIDIIKLYSDHIAVHLNSSEERIFEEYKKKYELEDMPTARVTRPQATATLATPPHAQPSPTEKFGERDRRLFNKRDATAVSFDNNTMAVAKRPAVR